MSNTTSKRWNKFRFLLVESSPTPNWRKNETANQVATFYVKVNSNTTPITLTFARERVPNRKQSNCYGALAAKSYLMKIRTSTIAFSIWSTHTVILRERYICMNACLLQNMVWYYLLFLIPFYMVFF